MARRTRRRSRARRGDRRRGRAPSRWWRAARRQCSASASSAARAPGEVTAPRPATSSGNEAASSSAATVSTSEVAGAGRPIVARRRRAGHLGLARGQVDRHVEHDRQPLGAGAVERARGVRGRRLRARARARRSRRTPRAIAAWSILKFDHWTADGVSAVSSSAGVRALAASTRPGQGVREPGALVRRAHGDAVRHAPVAVGHHHGAALVPRGVERRAGIAQLVREQEVAGADDAEDGVDSSCHQGARDDSRDAHPHASVMRGA